ncbi:MAG: hypothetical protein IPJ69_05500 [Deltaproteobacteria bacterium]|nr:MAG: hypothetical protein IPJ69_05500 [Deltaproteobacteria bacterium]
MPNTIGQHHRGPTHRHEGEGTHQVFQSLIGKGRSRMVGDADKIAESSPTRPNQVRDNFAMGVQIHSMPC